MGLSAREPGDREDGSGGGWFHAPPHHRNDIQAGRPNGSGARLWGGTVDESAMLRDLLGESRRGTVACDPAMPFAGSASASLPAATDGTVGRVRGEPWSSCSGIPGPGNRWRGGKEGWCGHSTPQGTGSGPQAGEGRGWWAAGCVAPGVSRSPRAIRGPAIRLGAWRKTSVPAAASRGELRPDPEIALPGGEALAEWAGSEAAHPAGERPAGFP